MSIFEGGGKNKKPGIPPIEENYLEKGDRKASRKLESLNVKSAKAIMADLTDSVLGVALKDLAKKDPKIAKLLDIPEFLNMVITGAKFDGERIRLFFEISDFTKNLRQLLLKNGYTNYSLETSKDEVAVNLYQSKLIINIKQVDKKTP